MRRSLRFELDKAGEAQIAAHLCACDAAFVPPLTGRVDIAEYARKIAGKALRFEAWADSELVGLVAAYCNVPDKRTAFITSVSVLPAWQGMSIASQLMERCITHVGGLSFARIELEVSGGNAAAITLYEKHGFSTDGSSGQSTIMTLNF